MCVELGEIAQQGQRQEVKSAGALTHGENRATGWRGSRELWLEEAYDVLINMGIQNVRILPLAKKLGLSRTSFYWFFEDREALLSALLQKWRDKNMTGLAARTQPKPKTISAAVLGVSHLWLEEENFD